MRDGIAVEDKQRQKPALRLAPFGKVKANDPGEVSVVVWHSAGAPPHSHQEQEVCAMLLGRKVRRVRQIGVQEHRHGGSFAHAPSFPTLIF